MSDTMDEAPTFFERNYLTYDETRIWDVEGQAETFDKLAKLRVPQRLSRHAYYIGIARMAALRSTCPRKSVGAVLVSPTGQVSTGYNGSARNLPHCTDDGCILEAGHCVRTVHAEINAILRTTALGGTMYTTHEPCVRCCLAIINAGVSQVYFAEWARDPTINVWSRPGEDRYHQTSLLDDAGIEFHHLQDVR